MSTRASAPFGDVLDLPPANLESDKVEAALSRRSFPREMTASDGGRSSRGKSRAVQSTVRARRPGTGDWTRLVNRCGLALFPSANRRRDRSILHSCLDHLLAGIAHLSPIVELIAGETPCAEALEPSTLFPADEPEATRRSPVRDRSRSNSHFGAGDDEEGQSACVSFAACCHLRVVQRASTISSMVRQAALSLGSRRRGRHPTSERPLRLSRGQACDIARGRGLVFVAFDLRFSMGAIFAPPRSVARFHSR